MQSWSVRIPPAIVQEDRKRRFFMLDEIRIAEGEGKVVGGEFLKIPKVMEYHGISWNVMESCFLLRPLWNLRVFRFLLRDLKR